MAYTFFAGCCDESPKTVTVNPMPQLESAINYLVQILAELRHHDNTSGENNSAEIAKLEQLHQDALTQLALAKANSLTINQIQMAIVNLNTSIELIVSTIANFTSSAIDSIKSLIAIIQAAEDRELSTLGGIKTAIEGMKPIAQVLNVVRLMATASANAQVIIPMGTTAVEAYVLNCDDGMVVNGVPKPKGAGHLLENHASSNAIVTHQQQTLSFKADTQFSLTYSFFGAPIRIQIANCTNVRINDPAMIAGFVAGNINDLMPIPDSLIQAESDNGGSSTP
jgi:hypothetical protein